MDSLTHALLGAAIGESVLGRQAGKKAMLMGGLAGLAPDIDVFVGMFMSDIDKLIFHRGITHSFAFILLSSPLVGWLSLRVDRFWTRRQPGGDGAPSASFAQWTLLAFLAQLSHILLDSFTSYGTQVYLPFISDAIALSTISIIDPLYTLPLIGSVLALIMMPATARHRARIGFLAVLLSSLYLGATVGNKMYVQAQFEQAYTEAGIEVEETDIKPTLFNNLLWRGIAREKGTDRYYTGYFSVADGRHDIRLYELEGHHELIQPWRDTKELRRLRWVSEGFYQIEAHPDGYLFNDLRFGRVSEFTDDEQTPYAFSYLIEFDDAGTVSKVQRIELNVDPQRERRSLGLLWARIWGDEQF